MQGRALFDAFCQQEGMRREDIENYPDAPTAPLFKFTRDIAEQYIADAIQKCPTINSIYFDFEHSPEVNAWATKFQGSYLIGISSGAMILLSLLMESILAHPQTFPAIGDPTNESQKVKYMDWSSKNPNAEIMYKNFIPVMAIDKYRSRYSNYLTQLAISFLLGHEIAHIARGHVDFLHKMYGLPFLSEVRWNNSFGSEIKIKRQAIESDADRRSIYSRAHSAQLLFESTDLETIQKHQNRTITISDLQFDWMFAVNVLFRMFGDASFASDRLEKSDYPPLAMRRAMAMDYTYRLLRSKYGEQNKDALFATIEYAIVAAEKSFELIGASIAEGGFNQSFEADSIKHMEKVIGCWNSIKSEVALHTHEDLDLK